MNLRERFRNIADRTAFIIWHSTTPEIADRARKVVVEHQNLIDTWISQGLVTVERLDEIAQDKELQGRFRKLLSKGSDGGRNAEEAMSELLQMRFNSPDLTAGFLQHFRKFYEWKWGLKLLSQEELNPQT